MIPDGTRKSISGIRISSAYAKIHVDGPGGGVSGERHGVLRAAGRTGAKYSARQNLSLNGPWKIIVDPYEAGYYDFHLNPLRDGGLGADRVPANKSDRLELTFMPNSATLQVPGDWNTQKPEFLWYEGTIWYKREFDYVKKPGRRLFLWFGAANYQAIVFLNGHRLGQHEGGFTPFQFEVTDAVRDGANAVIVKVDNQRHADAVPPAMTDWWNYGGLTRDVKVIDVPETFVQDYFVQLEKGSLKRIAGWVRLDGSHKRQKVAIRIPESGASTVVDTDENGYARFAFDANLTPWSPENPKLYDVFVEAETDRVQERIGFRTIEANGQKILLNGKPVFLRGVSIHAEAPFRAGRVFSEADARVLLTWAKELGCNFVRLAHYPHDEVMTRMADQMGLLVWSEVPVYWAVQWENPAAYANAERQLTEMIGRDHNRASIIFWSMANETPLGDARLKFLSSMAAKARELDATRLITAATLVHYSDATTLSRLTIHSANTWMSWAATNISAGTMALPPRRTTSLSRPSMTSPWWSANLAARRPTAGTATKIPPGPKSSRPTSTATRSRC